MTWRHWDHNDIFFVDVDFVVLHVSAVDWAFTAIAFSLLFSHVSYFVCVKMIKLAMPVNIVVIAGKPACLGRFPQQGHKTPHNIAVICEYVLFYCCTWYLGANIPCTDPRFSCSVQLYIFIVYYCAFVINCYRSTLTATTAFLDAFQRVADLATGSKGNLNKTFTHTCSAKAPSCCIHFSCVAKRLSFSLWF